MHEFSSEVDMVHN